MKTLNETIVDLTLISTELKALFASKKMTAKGLGILADLSTNTVKSILNGEPANIVNYDSICRALGTSLVQVIQGLRASTGGSTTSTTTTTPTGGTSVVVTPGVLQTTKEEPVAEVQAEPEVAVEKKTRKPRAPKEKEDAESTAAATFSL